MKLSAGALQGSKFLATQAVSVGQNTFQFVVGMGVMLYLLFFLLRDGAQLARQSKQLIPLSDEHQQHLFRKFATVVRATVKGNIVVAITQGALGGVMFWFLGIQGALLWGVLMAFLSLLPAVGAALIWVPVAVYFLVTGATWEGVVLILFGVLVIGLVVLFAFGLLCARLFFLQVVRHEDLAEQAESNRTAIVPVVPNRGLILDRNGVVLATNYSAYTLEITPSKVRYSSG